MLRRIKAVLLVALVFCMAISVPAFAEEIEFNAEVKVNYDDSKISFTVESPAKYRQVISVRMFVGDPEVLVRTMEVTADARGNAAGVFTMDTSADNADISGYYTLKFQGGGYMASSSKDEVTVFYERNSELYDETLPLFDAERLKNDMTIIGAFYRALEPKLMSDDKNERKKASLALRYGLAALCGRDING